MSKRCPRTGRRIRLLCLLIAGAALPAQDFIGFSYNVESLLASRGSLGTSAGEVMTRIDGSEYAGWGTDTPGTRTVTSVFFVVQDQLAQPVANTFDIVLYPEDPASPGMPQTAAGVVFAAGVPGPTGTGTGAAVAKVVTPATPASVPIQGGGSVFVSFSLGAVTATKYLSVWTVMGYAPAIVISSGFDLPGPAQPPATPWGFQPTPVTVQNTHRLTLLNGSPILNPRGMHFLDVAHHGTGGAVLGITNQTWYPVSNNPPPPGAGPAPGTASFMSGVAPDVTGFNAGRADDIAFDFIKIGIGTGAPVFFLMDLSGGFGPEIPIATIVPGSGVICLRPSAVVIGLVLTTADEAFKTTLIPAGLRPSLGGLIVTQQAAAIDTANNLLMSPCGAQKF